MGGELDFLSGPPVFRPSTRSYKLSKFTEKLVFYWLPTHKLKKPDFSSYKAMLKHSQRKSCSHFSVGCIIHSGTRGGNRTAYIYNIYHLRVAYYLHLETYSTAAANQATAIIVYTHAVVFDSMTPEFTPKGGKQLLGLFSSPVYITHTTRYIVLFFPRVGVVPGSVNQPVFSFYYPLSSENLT